MHSNMFVGISFSILAIPQKTDEKTLIRFLVEKVEDTNHVLRLVKKKLRSSNVWNQYSVSYFYCWLVFRIKQLSKIVDPLRKKKIVS